MQLGPETARPVSAIVWRRRVPALAAGWLAFAAIVAPVLGFTQSGPQLVADRYTYIACWPFALSSTASGAQGNSDIRKPPLSVPV